MQWIQQVSAGCVAFAFDATVGLCSLHQMPSGDFPLCLGNREDTSCLSCAQQALTCKFMGVHEAMEHYRYNIYILYIYIDINTVVCRICFHTVANFVRQNLRFSNIPELCQVH